MILTLDYHSGHGHMTVDLEKFLPCSLARWRRLTAVMYLSVPAPIGEVRKYLDDRASAEKQMCEDYKNAIWAAERKLESCRLNAGNLRERRKQFKKSSEEYVQLTAEAKAVDEAGHEAVTRRRFYQKKLKDAMKYLEHYPEYVKILGSE